MSTATPERTYEIAYIRDSEQLWKDVVSASELDDALADPSTAYKLGQEALDRTRCAFAVVDKVHEIVFGSPEAAVDLDLFRVVRETFEEQGHLALIEGDEQYAQAILSVAGLAARWASSEDAVPMYELTEEVDNG